MNQVYSFGAPFTPSPDHVGCCQDGDPLCSLTRSNRTRKMTTGKNDFPPIFPLLRIWYDSALFSCYLSVVKSSIGLSSGLVGGCSCPSSAQNANAVSRPQGTCNRVVWVVALWGVAGGLTHSAWVKTTVSVVLPTQRYRPISHYPLPRRFGTVLPPTALSFFLIHYVCAARLYLPRQEHWYLSHPSIPARPYPY